RGEAGKYCELSRSRTRTLGSVIRFCPFEETGQPFVERHDWLESEIPAGLADVRAPPLRLVPRVTLRVRDDLNLGFPRRELAHPLRQLQDRDLRSRATQVVRLPRFPLRERLQDADHNVRHVGERPCLLPGLVHLERLPRLEFGREIRRGAVIRL